MKSIKPYLLSLFLLLFFSVPSFSQSDVDSSRGVKQQAFSKADSVLAASYLSEIDYNEINGINDLNEEAYSKPFYGDEIYNEEPIHKNKRRNHFWDSVAAELVVEVVVHTTFLIATFWH
jgi:hypothetical protein